MATSIPESAGHAAPQYDFYVAGPFFDDGQVRSMERLEAALESQGKRLFKPRFGESEHRERDDAWAGLCFQEDLAGMHHSAAVIANLIGADAGTMFEIGYAYSRGMPVYAYAEGLAESDSINLMIAQSVREVFDGARDLTHWLTTGEHTPPRFRQF